MSDTDASPGIGRSILAVFAGFIVVVLLSVGTDFALHGLKIYPPLGQPMSDGLFGLATIYRTIYGVLGSYITARVAPNRPMFHALIGGAIGFALSLVGAVMTWNRGPEYGPHWYPLALVLFALPQSWLGGKLRVTQLAKSAVAQSQAG